MTVPARAVQATLLHAEIALAPDNEFVSRHTPPPIVEDDVNWFPRGHDSDSDFLGHSSSRDDSFKSQHGKSGAFPAPGGIHSQNISLSSDSDSFPPTTSRSFITAVPAYRLVARSVPPTQVNGGPPPGLPYNGAPMYVRSTAAVPASS